MHWKGFMGAGLFGLLIVGCGTSGLILEDSPEPEARSFRLVKVMADW